MEKFTYLRKGMLIFLLIWSHCLMAQNVEVTGTVSDESGEPIPGATVLVKGTTQGTATDVEGFYRLSAPGDATLVFSFVGYVTQEMTVNNRSVIDVELVADFGSLEEIVVIGYGTARKRDLTGAVSSVTATRLENENPNSVQDVLRGNIAGLNVGMETSAKGGGGLEVRGRTSLNAGRSPLIVLDGAIYYGQLSDINPNDIESVDVLKDASSAAVFGAKAASGVIMVNTKMGEGTKPTVKLNTNWGLATMSVNEKILGPHEFISWREDVMKSINAGGYEPYRFSDPRNLPSNISMDEWMAYDGSDGDPVTVWLQRLNMQPAEIENYKAGRSVNWYDKMFQNGLRQDHTVSLSGRSEGLKYYWSLGYLDNEGLIVGDRFTTIRSRVNLEGKVNDFLSVGVHAQFADRDESQVPVSWGDLRVLSPWGSEYDEQGDYKWRPNDEASGGQHPYYNPSHITRLQKETTLNTTLFANIDLPFGFSFRTNFTPRYEFYERYNHESANHAEWGARGGIASRQQRKIYYWQVDNILNWSKNFNDVHNFDVTFLANAEKYQSWDNTMTNNGFEPHDRLGFHNISSGINPIVSSNDQYHTGDALMGRLIYSLYDRYILTASVRRDGYSAFGQKNPRATFYSTALGWVFTDEGFINANWLDYGKLRLSYGVNGNRDIGRYAALSDLNTGKYFYQRPDGNLYFVNQLYVNTMMNENLRWEKTASLNVGVDFSIFDLIDGTLEVYEMSTTDLLVERSLPDILGFNWVYDNLGEVRNRGFEISLNSTNIHRENFSWRSGLNFQLNRNEIVSLYGDLGPDGKELDDFENQWFIGRPIDQIWHWKTLGIWQSDEADEASRYGVRPGDYKIEDVNDDGLFTIADRQFLGYSEPRFRWSLRNEFKLYKNFDLSFMLYSYWGHSSSFNQLKNRDGFLDRTSSYVFPYWTEENPNNEWARLYSSEGGASGFSVYRKRSFVRLENISFAYTVPSALTQKLSVQNLRLYGNIRNVAFFAPTWDFWDPEWHPDNGPGPTPRYFTLGLDITF